jgi:hypothetical protein
MYLHKDRPRTPEQQRGIDFHKARELEIKKNKKTRIGNTILKFDEPETELKVYVPYSEEIQLSAIFDCVDGNTVYDWKTGEKSAFEHGTGLQIPFYFFVLEKMGRHMKNGIIVHWNFETEKSSYVHITNSKRMMEKGENLVQTVAPDLIKYFSDNGIL